MLTKLYVKTRNAVKCEEGATAVEYGLMVALIAVAIIFGVTAIGGNLNGMFSGIADLLVLE